GCSEQKHRAGACFDLKPSREAAGKLIARLAGEVLVYKNRRPRGKNSLDFVPVEELAGVATPVSDGTFKAVIGIEEDQVAVSQVVLTVSEPPSPILTVIADGFRVEYRIAQEFCGLNACRAAVLFVVYDSCQPVEQFRIGGPVLARLCQVREMATIGAAIRRGEHPADAKAKIYRCD
ncbi:MAG: hypothetical protein ABJC09_11285, partial [Terriglobia bacterium]